jgi:hypothetical protein
MHLLMIGINWFKVALTEFTSNNQSNKPSMERQPGLVAAVAHLYHRLIVSRVYPRSSLRDFVLSSCAPVVIITHHRCVLQAHTLTPPRTIRSHTVTVLIS